MTYRMLTGFVLAAGLAAGTASCCKHDAQPGAMQPSNAEARMQPASGTSSNEPSAMEWSCPMTIQGVQVDCRDADGSAVLAFTTKSGDVSELRRRVQHMARMYEMCDGGGAKMNWYRASGTMTRSHRMHHIRNMNQRMTGQTTMMRLGTRMPMASAQAEDVPQGEQIVFIPDDVSNLGTLRDAIQHQQQRMSSGQCWNLKGSS